MTDTPDKSDKPAEAPPQATPEASGVSAAKRALELKRAAASGANGKTFGGRKQTERVAAARSMSKSKPQMRK
jgi:hypothetical protein